MTRSYVTAATIAASLVATALLLASCGSDHKTITNRLVPMAQSEADLRRALDMGAISQSEYNDQIDRLHHGD
ncbi:hypothetical protein ACFPL7_04220 [Dongia soli]|uniref:SHOCT domain-containing protein n=1 Tax=Dongia soli TaxID=600628 RepID=A0ABU5EEA7_9PROT|nr:hypothetical protein [Dongia soli]MDY0884502.1 hypothetical protein [Dongia soli]